MLQFGIRGHDVPCTEGFEQWVGQISDLGFCCTQLALKKAVKEFNVDCAAMTPGMAMYMKKVFQENAVDVAVLGCYLNLTTPDIGDWKRIQKEYEAHIRFASLLGCGMVGTETGAMNIEYRPDPSNRTPEALQKLIERLKVLTSFAESMGVILGIEPVCRHIMWNIEQTRKVLDAVHSPNLRVIFDPVNLLDLENYEKQNDVINEAFRELKQEIDVVHIKDFRREGNQLITKPIALGEGLLNLPLIISHIKYEKPYIHILLEDSNPDNCITSKEYIESVYRRV